MGPAALQMPMPQNMLESEMIGAIKIKDGLFIGDELASTVSFTPQFLIPARKRDSNWHSIVNDSTLLAAGLSVFAPRMSSQADESAACGSESQFFF